jgi:hypothetical protein
VVSAPATFSGPITILIAEDGEIVSLIADVRAVERSGRRKSDAADDESQTGYRCYNGDFHFRISSFAEIYRMSYLPFKISFT